VTDNNYISSSSNAQSLVRRIEQIKAEITQNQYLSIGENAMLRVHEIIALLNFPEAPRITTMNSTVHASSSTLMVNNNITMGEIDEAFEINDY
jgi:hypothetical protein